MARRVPRLKQRALQQHHPEVKSLVVSRRTKTEPVKTPRGEASARCQTLPVFLSSLLLEAAEDAILLRSRRGKLLGAEEHEKAEAFPMLALR
ncbi:hypothetical protein OPV22_001170 [Ensete ventricosum]|uniref:Uncharacterized protein n=1 Tax=Ensete ventricosum TaxID=4639 RepID=A0AAV8QI32_ENSVE|nr:hypothetical protein OPV22_001170 [Ensete ventricosum]